MTILNHDELVDVIQILKENTDRLKQDYARAGHIWTTGNRVQKEAILARRLALLQKLKRKMTALQKIAAKDDDDRRETLLVMHTFSRLMEKED